jgi:peptidoglycan/LPS O-acetylase OafA/YrhL
VLPLYYAVIAVLFLVLVWIPWSGFDWLRDLQSYQALYWLHLANAGRIMNVLDPASPTVHWLSTYWSLSVEEHFYLIWPLILLACPRRRLPLVCVTGVVLALLFRVACSLAGLNEQVIYYNTLTRFDPLLLGSLLACLSSRLDRLERPARWVAGVGTVVLAASVVWGPPMLGRETDWGKVFVYSLVGIYFMAIVLVAARARPQGWLMRLLSRGPLPLFGKYSYALYVLNKPVFILVGWYLPVASCEVFGSYVVAGVLAFVVGTALTLLAALCSWHLLEKRCLKLKRFFESRPATASAEPASSCVNAQDPVQSAEPA